MLMSKFILGIAAAMVAALVGIASYTYFKQPEDNTVEECAEEIIKYQIGWQVDLSPDSKEIR